MKMSQNTSFFEKLTQTHSNKNLSDTKSYHNCGPDCDPYTQCYPTMGTGCYPYQDDLEKNIIKKQALNKYF